MSHSIELEWVGKAFPPVGSLLRSTHEVPSKRSEDGGPVIAQQPTEVRTPSSRTQSRHVTLCSYTPSIYVNFEVTAASEEPLDARAR